MSTPKTLASCFWRALAHTVDHDGIEHAGYLAFLGLLALFPFLVLIVSLIGVFGQGENGAAFIASMLQTFPEDITAALRPRIMEIISGPPQGLLTVSILGAIWTASSAVEGLRTVLNRAYHVGTPPAYWLRRSLSILQLLVFALILLSGILLMVAIPLVLHHLEIWLGFHLFSEDGAMLRVIIFAGTMLILFAAVSYIYYIIPNIRQEFVSVAPGASVVVVLWLAASQLFTLYLSNFDQVQLIYGGLGGIIAALIFAYICNVIFIFGAELNYQISQALGLRVVQREAAVSQTDPAAAE